MLDWLRKKSSKAAAQVAQVVDPWRGCEGLYLSLFKNEFEEIAKILAVSHLWHTCKVHFKEELECTEFYSDTIPAIQVKVGGSEGSPTTAVVSTCFPMSQSVREVFTRNLRTLRVEFETYAQAA